MKLYRSKAHRGAYLKGWNAFAQARPRWECPYQGRELAGLRGNIPTGQRDDHKLATEMDEP